MLSALLYGLVLFLVSAAGGFAVGLLRFKGRPLVLIAWLLTPLIMYSLVLATAEPAEGGFWVWWQVGLLFMALPQLCWSAGALIGFSVGKERQSKR